MNRPALVLRPEPGNAATVTRLKAAGIAAIALPLFAVAPIAWVVPPIGEFDALLLTSANALRHAGDGARDLRALPVVAVGEATAEAARAAGFTVAVTGTEDAAAAVADAYGAEITRMIRLGGRDRSWIEGVVDVAVYDSVEVDLAAGAMAVAAGAVALLHSPRAAQRFAALVDRDAVDRSTVRIVALSAAIATAAGKGWGAVAQATTPTDAALVALAAKRAIDP